MPKSTHDAPKALALMMRRMWVFVIIAVLVMSAMQRDPLQQWPLDSHGTENGKHKLHGAVGLKGAMGEQAMEAHRNAEAGQYIHPQKQCQITPSESPSPKRYDGCDQPKNGVITAMSVAVRTFNDTLSDGGATRAGN